MKVLEIMAASLETALLFVAFVTGLSVEDLRTKLEKWWLLHHTSLEDCFLVIVSYCGQTFCLSNVSFP